MVWAEKALRGFAYTGAVMLMGIILVLTFFLSELVDFCARKIDGLGKLLLRAHGWAMSMMNDLEKEYNDGRRAL